jgi:hypothetical protein
MSNRYSIESLNNEDKIVALNSGNDLSFMLSEIQNNNKEDKIIKLKIHDNFIGFTSTITNDGNIQENIMLYGE